MKLLMVILCIAAAQAGSLYRHRTRQADSSWIVAAKLLGTASNSPSNLQSQPLPFSSYSSPNAYSQLNLQNQPLAPIELASKSNNFLENFEQSSPKPNFDSVEQFASSTFAPDNLVNLQSVSSSPVPFAPNIQELPADIRLANFNQGSVSSTPAPFIQNVQELQRNIPLVNFNQASVYSTPAPFVQNLQELQVANFNQERLSIPNYNQPQINVGDQNPVTVKAFTSGGSIDDAFGISEEPQFNENEEVEVLKNVYFFAAPEEPEAIQPRINFIQPAKKNVNVIFIKAPAAPKISPVHISPPEVKQDKTIVYVLVKKPDVNQEIIVKAAPVSKPHKPEVYFLKYKNEAEAQEVVNQVKDGEGEPSAAKTGAAGGSQYLSDRTSISETGHQQFPIGGPVQVDINDLPEYLKNQVVNIGGNQLTPESLSISSDAPFVGGAASFQSNSDSPLFVSNTPFASGEQSFVSSTASPLFVSSTPFASGEKSFGSSTVSPLLVSSTPFASGEQSYVSSTVSPIANGEFSYKSSTNSPFVISNLIQKYLPPN